MAESHRNNNKNHPNLYTDLHSSSVNDNQLVVCHVCKQAESIAGGASYGKLRDHLQAVHGYATTVTTT